MPAAKNDLELIVDRIATLLKNNLNTKLASITTEKNDSITMEQFNSTNAYALLELNTKIFNFDPILAILVDDITSDSRGPATMHLASLFILAIKADNGTDAADVVHRKMCRYMRAIEEVFEDNFDSLELGTKYNIRSLAPKRLADLNDDKPFRSAGVVLSFSYTS